MSRRAPMVCLHGPESTGKSSTADRLVAEFGGALIPEYGRSFCETYGIDLAMEDLVDIAETHAAMTAAARERTSGLIILDTDPLMTAVWADMLFNKRDPWFARFDDVADLYLLFDIDIPWIDDGTRMFGAPAARRRFFDLCRAELVRRGVRWRLIGGTGAERTAAAIAAIRDAGLA